MNRWFLRIIAVVSFAVAIGSFLHTPIIKITPTQTISSSIRAQKVAPFTGLQTIVINEAVAQGDRLYLWETKAYRDMIVISNFGLFVVGLMTFIASFLPFTRVKAEQSGAANP